MVGFAGHIIPGLCFLLFGSSVYFVDPLCAANDEVAGALFPYGGMGLALFLLAGLFAVLDLLTHQLMDSYAWTINMIPIHNIHHFMLYQGYGLIGLAETIVRRCPGLLMQEVVSLTCAAACFLEGFLMSGHFDAAFIFEDRIHIFILVTAIVSGLGFSIYAMKATPLYRNIGLYCIILRGLMYIIIAFWYLIKLRYIEGTPECVDDCSARFSVNGSPLKAAWQGLFVKQATAPTADQDGRPIFKNNAGMYLYFWKRHHMWRIGQDYRSSASFVSSAHAKAVPTDVRIRDGGTYGRLEVFHDARWGTLCEDSLSSVNAQVACRSLGMTGGALYEGDEEGKQTISLARVSCSGSESSIIFCSHSGRGNPTCDKSLGVKIECELRCEVASDCPGEKFMCVDNLCKANSEYHHIQIMKVHLVTGSTALLLGLAFVLRLSCARHTGAGATDSLRKQTYEMVSIIGKGAAFDEEL